MPIPIAAEVAIAEKGKRLDAFGILGFFRGLFENGKRKGKRRDTIIVPSVLSPENEEEGQ